ncbi:MAG: 5-histidylcysteine sulfoxide synthase [Myxococcales bacterium]|nr:5-histidylcysteine sulfoxide synthase [Myxococcales bacterium]
MEDIIADEVRAHAQRGPMQRRREPLPPDLRHVCRDSARAYFEASWSLNELLFRAITHERAFFTQPDPLRQPLVFYLGHTAAFYVNKLRLAGLASHGLDAHLDALFARGVDPESADELDGQSAWPSVDSVWAYRRAAREQVLAAIEALPWEAPITEERPEWAVLMGIEHARIHFETSSMLLRQAPVEHLTRPRGWRYADDAPVPAERFVHVPAGDTAVGRPRGGRLFGWDNEYGHDTREVPAFDVGADLVTNAQFLAFVDAGGYRDERLWSPAGWAWRSAHGVEGPRFWLREGTRPPRYRAMFDELPLPLSWPAEVNAIEADAYCRWRDGVRLPTEAEWCRMLDVTEGARDDEEGAHFHLHFELGSPRPVGATCRDRGRALHDVRGNVWQWLSDDFHPLPGFRTHPLYDDFSVPYFDAEHAMLRGGAWATTGTGASVHYRLWFRRHFYQHAGFRLVRCE